MENMRTAGFLTELDDDQLKLLEYLGGRLSLSQLQNILGMDEKALKAALETEKAQKAIAIGRGDVHLSIVEKIISKALDGDNAMLTLYAKTQMGWKDTQAIEHSTTERAMTLDDFYENSPALVESGEENEV